MPIGEREPRPEKIEAVDEIREVLNSSAVILTDFQGLDVKALSKLRGKLRESGSGYRVVKNTLFRLAAADTASKPLIDGLVGPTAVVYSEDPIAAAKALQDFLKGPKPIRLKSAVVDGHLLGVEQVEELAKIPPREQLYAMVVGGLQSPISGLVSTLQQLTGQLVMTLQGIADKKGAAA